ncbi:MAG: fasciclin domain-containing protein [Anaerolineae bacterium]|nr:fasciclin domain-containing protein [Anaerolineae bacterium]
MNSSRPYSLQLFVARIILLLPCFLLLINVVPGKYVHADECKSPPCADTVVADPFNSRLAVQVGANGRFNMGAFPNPATGGSTTTSWDLMYRWPNAPSTSFTTLRIDGVDSIYGSSGTQIQAPIDINASTNQSQWRIGDIEVTQVLQLASNSQTGQDDAALIAYVVHNTGSGAHQVGLRMMIDTEINYNDGAPFRVPGAGILTTEQEFIGTAVPDSFQVFYNVTDSEHVAAATLRGANATPPDRLVLAHWPQIYNTSYDYTVTSGHSFTSDSAYATYWNPSALAPGESRTYATHYGLGEVTVDLQPPLALGVSGPESVEAGSSEAFSIVATVFNNGTATATNVQLTLNLPVGLTLASGSAAQAIGDLAVGQERQVSWSVLAGSQATQTLTYSVQATASNAQAKTVSREITVTGSPSVLCDVSPYTDLDTCDLEPGDILLETGLSSTELVLGGFIGSYWFHTAMYDEDENGAGYVIEAAGTASYPDTNPICTGSEIEQDRAANERIFCPAHEVRRIPVTWSGFYGTSRFAARDWVVLRLRHDVPDRATVIDQALAWARSKAEGTNARFLDISNILLNPSVKFQDSEFYCALFVWRAYSEAGIDLDYVGSLYNATQSWRIVQLILAQVLPDDIYASSIGGVPLGRSPVTEVVQDKHMGQNVLRTIYILLSPADLLVTDGDGNVTGNDARAGTIRNEIPGAYYSGPETEPEWIAALLSEGTTHVQVTGTGDGEYVFGVQVFQGSSMNNDFVVSETQTGQVDIIDVLIDPDGMPSVQPVSVLGVDQTHVVVSEGQTAVNTGTVPQSGSENLRASIGTIINNRDGTWSWSYLADDGDATATVTIAVDDDQSGSTETSFALTVSNIQPTATFVNSSGAINVGDSAILSFVDQFDPSAADTAAGFSFSYDCTNDGLFELEGGPTSTYGCVYDTSGTYQALGRIQDKDGGYTDYLVEVPVSEPSGDVSTIADFIMNATQSDPAQFTILLAAIQNADPLVLAVLSDPTASVTFFAPTDDAFRNMFNRLGINVSEYLNNRRLLSDVLLYHIVLGEYDATTLFDLSHSGWPYDLLPTLQGTRVEFTDDDGTLIVDYAWVIDYDIHASNGIVHTIGAVLDPSFIYGEDDLLSTPESTVEPTPEATPEPTSEPEPLPTIAQHVMSTAQSDPTQFSILLAMIQNADPGVLTMLSDPATNLTLFAPTDEAIRVLVSQQGMTIDQLLADPTLLTQILLYHIVGWRYDAATLFGLADAGWPNDLLPTLQGETVELTNDDGTLIINYAWVITPDVQTSNGIIHVIGAALMPPYEPPVREEPALAPSQATPEPTVDNSIEPIPPEEDPVPENDDVTPELPTISIEASAVTGPAPLTVQFAVLSTGEVSSYTWNFGDGISSTDMSPMHTFENAGQFAVVLTVVGPAGSSSQMLEITVEGEEEPAP